MWRGVQGWPSAGVHKTHTHTPHFVDASELLPQLGKAAENKPIEEAGVLIRSRWQHWDSTCNKRKSRALWTCCPVPLELQVAHQPGP